MPSDFVNSENILYPDRKCKAWVDYYPENPKPLPVIKFKKLSPSAIIPEKKTAGAACWDLFVSENAYVPFGYCDYGTDIAIELPPGCVGLVCSRSGLAAKNGIFVLNAPGVIDEDYRGEIRVILGRMNEDLGEWDSSSKHLPAGSRIAQLMVLPLQEYQVEVVDELSATDRGEGGLGSTGL